MSPETCNGVDDDCNGAVDDLGTFTCGVGACVTTVTACGPNAELNACVPAVSSATVDGCDGIDNDCDGAVDEDCTACARVAPNGDDAAALADGNATPFASVQAAIDFASTHPDAPPRVCVAGGATCVNSATFDGPADADLTMRDGIDVFANYEATTWSRCSARTTTLAPQTPAGVVFPSVVTAPTTLDGFVIAPSIAGTSTAAVTVNGAKNVVLSNLFVPAITRFLSVVDGVVLESGAEALLFRSRIEVTNGGSELYGIKSIASRLRVEDSTGCAASTNSASGNGIVYQTQGLAKGNGSAILLEDSPGSRVESSDVCGGVGNGGHAAAVEIHGDGTGVVLRDDVLAVKLHGMTSSALMATDCAGAAPWIVGNRIVDDHGSASSPELVYAAGDCHPRIDSNPSINLVLSTPGKGTAIHCGTLGGVDSRCIVSNNRDVGLSFPDGIGGPSVTADYGYGVVCDNASCARIDHNGIAGVAGIGAQVSVHGYGYGVVAAASNALISANTIVGMGSYTCNGDALGVSAGNGARVENNFIVGSRGYNPIPGPSCDGEQPATGLAAAGADVDSNYVYAWPTATCGAINMARTLAYGVQLVAAGGTFRNNYISGCASVQEAGASADPLVFEHNDIPNGYLDEGAVYPNYDFSDPRLGVSQVNTATDMTASGNIAEYACFVNGSTHLVLAASSACVDAGTPTGAPGFDYDGVRRDATPDIGPVEYVP